jgi:cell division transport system permease protein
MGTWIARHGRAFATSIRLLCDHNTTALLTIFVLALGLALPLALGLVVLEAGPGSAMHRPAAAVAVYLKPTVSEQQARQLAASARARHDVAAVSLITASQALQELRARSGLGTALDALADNPLPNALAIVPAPATNASMSAELETLRAAFAALPETDAVQLDGDWARRWDASTNLAHALLRLTAVLLGLLAIALVANSTRLAIQARRAEIELAKLVGASNAFVRRPFLYLGALYGLAAGLLAFALVVLAGRVLAGPAGALAGAYGLTLTPAWPDPRELAGFFGAALVLGWIGALLAAAQQMARLDAWL